ncbi:hypothetical protein [Iodobacter fluviatilis]|uniref:Uncharacterized protein n=1 Tax=Iodobacter fluviatilis TaxID=537 RepID=A0A377Q8F5_9NEIS|nr:hypothetical protein [Iodobacter fluviatilis]TCU88821.1 hypothetical protein EV682_103405 [Iodobacter fluviatilis]STQ91107.1 Uncharacterised protein [Iodobacter fluviatilis]
MGIEKGVTFTIRDVYIDYEYEEVMFRWDHVSQKTYVKFYGESEKHTPVDHKNRLFNDALLSGNEISKEQYENGRVR